MSISVVPGSHGAAVAAAGPAGSVAGGEASPRVGPGHVRSAPRSPELDPPRAAGALGAHPPPGTDPSLWRVLTAAERSFFERAGSMGAPTYAPGRVAGRGAPPVGHGIVGGRLDVKV